MQVLRQFLANLRQRQWSTHAGVCTLNPVRADFTVDVVLPITYLRVHRCIGRDTQCLEKQRVTVKFWVLKRAVQLHLLQGAMAQRTALLQTQTGKRTAG